MTHNVPASPPSKAKPEPYTSGDVAGLVKQQAVWYDVEGEVEPLYNGFHHDQCHVALLSMLPTSRPCRLIGVATQCFLSGMKHTVQSTALLHTHVVAVRLPASTEDAGIPKLAVGQHSKCRSVKLTMHHEVSNRYVHMLMQEAV